MKKKSANRTLRLLHIVQHIAIVAAVVSILVVITGSSVLLTGYRGMYTYTISDEDRNSNYEDSYLFNHILGRDTADIMHYAAIRSQLETDGVFDGQKIIDVTAYAYRNEVLPEQYITVKYPLEDLIKWAKTGFDYNNYWYTGEQVNEFLSNLTTVTTIDYDEANANSGWNKYFNSEFQSHTETYDVTANTLENGEIVRDDTDCTILTNRYHTVDGRNIEDYVSTWGQYYDLCAHVQQTAEDLNANYEEYLRYQDYYDGDQSNVRYYIQKQMGNRTESYTNTGWNPISDPDKISSLFQEYGSFLYYDPVTMQYDTNSMLTRDTVQNLLRQYEYAFPENTRIWIGVDTTFPVYDEFSQGLTGISNYAPYYWQLIGLSLFSAALYLFLLFYLTIREGRQKMEDGTFSIVLNKFDRLPTELMLISACLSGALLTAAVLYVTHLSPKWFYTTAFIFAAGAFALAADLVFCLFYYSIVRRLKANTLWRDSLLRLACGKAKQAALDLYDNGTVAVRTFVPYVLFLLLNLILVSVSDFFSWWGAGIFAAVLLDIVVGMLIYRNNRNRQKVIEGIEKIKAGEFDYKVDKQNFHGDNVILADAVNSIGDSIRTAVETSMKDERLKADLITNVSHDIKTPLTSIINYVDLIKRANVQDEKIRGYVEVLDAKSQRLKQLTDDLVEASKISSGNLSLQMEKINLVELVNQTIGEFSEKFEQKALTPVFRVKNANMSIEADSRRIWRVIENLFGNIFKYALEGTRVYMDMDEQTDDNGRKHVTLSIKNISAQPLNINSDELTERFIRGDVARSTEGSGLGLSIAKNLTEAQHGAFDIYLDGDLFKVVLTFPLLEDN